MVRGVVGRAGSVIDERRDLGVVNLTNTVPSLIMPWLTLALVPSFGFSGLFALLALLAFASAIILAANGTKIISD